MNIKNIFMFFILLFYSNYILKANNVISPQTVLKESLIINELQSYITKTFTPFSKFKYLQAHIDPKITICDQIFLPNINTITTEINYYAILLIKHSNKSYLYFFELEMNERYIIKVNQPYYNFEYDKKSINLNEIIDFLSKKIHDKNILNNIIIIARIFNLINNAILNNKTTEVKNIQSRDIIFLEKGSFQTMDYIEHPVAINDKPMIEDLGYCTGMIISNGTKLWIRRFSEDYDIHESLEKDFNGDENNEVFNENSKIIFTNTSYGKWRYHLNKLIQTLIKKGIRKQNIYVDDFNVQPQIDGVNIYIFPKGEVLIHKKNFEVGIVEAISFNPFLSNIQNPEVLSKEEIEILLQQKKDKVPNDSILYKFINTDFNSLYEKEFIKLVSKLQYAKLLKLILIIDEYFKSNIKNTSKLINDIALLVDDDTSLKTLFKILSNKNYTLLDKYMKNLARYSALKAAA